MHQLGLGAEHLDHPPAHLQGSAGSWAAETPYISEGCRCCLHIPSVTRGQGLNALGREEAGPIPQGSRHS